RTSGANPGRDGCRVPLPWSGKESPFGFSPDGAVAGPWLPQPASWRYLTVEAQQGDPASMLEFYRAALRIRRIHPALGDGSMIWLEAPADVLAFRREPAFTCVINMSTMPAPLPAHREILIAS